MRNFILLISLGFAIIACNSNTDSSSSQKDTTNHSEHNSPADTVSMQNHMQGMYDAMNKMMQQMQTMSMTGNPDHDFAMMMMHHHKGAIDMAKVEMNGGEDETMRQMAQKIISEQQKEIDQFNIFMQQDHPHDIKSDLGQKMMGMMTPMSNIGMEGNSLDAMFASMMIPHHEDGVKMAKAYLDVGKNEELRKIAENIAETQPKEIQEFQLWLKKQKS